MRMFVFITLLLLSGYVAGCGHDGASGSPIRLATTTSTENSGLLADLLPPFEKETGLRVHVIAAGTGRALELGRRGDADLILVHARSREDAFVAEGHGTERRDIMWNDFVIAGPKEDPVGVRGTQDAKAALRKIAAAKAEFISRGDDSGTHTRERELWEAAGGRPDWDGYAEVGQGMGKCLTIADNNRAYVLTDRGTYVAYRGKLELEVLVEGDEALHNPYGAILVNPEKHEPLNAEGARKLLDYLTSPEGRERIGAFRVKGEVLFHPHAGE